MRTPSLGLSLFGLLPLAACQNADTGAIADDPHGRISGIVTDVSGTGLEGVEVTAQGQSVLSGANGHYTLEQVDPGQQITVKFVKRGYSENVRYTNIHTWETANANATLKAHDWTAQFNARTGGVFQGEGMRVRVPAGAVSLDGKPYSGTVQLSMTYFDPYSCLLYTSPSPRDVEESRMPSSA